MPRLAQRRVILFFWPMRASSAIQISMYSDLVAKVPSALQLDPEAVQRAIAESRKEIEDQERKAREEEERL